MFCKKLENKVEKMEEKIKKLNDTINELLTLLDIEKEDYIDKEFNCLINYTMYPYIQTTTEKVIKERLVKKSKKNK